MKFNILTGFLIALAVNVCISQQLSNDGEIDVLLNGSGQENNDSGGNSGSGTSGSGRESGSGTSGSGGNSGLGTRGSGEDSGSGTSGSGENSGLGTSGSGENSGSGTSESGENPGSGTSGSGENSGSGTYDGSGGNSGLGTSGSGDGSGSGENNNTSEETKPHRLTCDSNVEKPFSMYVTSIRISGHKVNRSEAPFGFTREEWRYWMDNDYNVTAQVTYTVRRPSHCSRHRIFYSCDWPSLVANTVWSLSQEKANFTQSSASRIDSNGDLTTTITATDPHVIPTVTTFFSLQSDNTIFRYDYIFSQSNYKGNSFELSYSPIIFDCYPPTTVHVQAGEDLVLSWSYTMNPGPGETKEDLMDDVVRMTGYTEDVDYQTDTPNMNYNRYHSAASLAGSGIQNSTVWNNGIWTLGPDDYRLGTLSRQVEETDDGYSGILQLHLPRNNVGIWLRGSIRMNFGGMSTITHIAVDDENTNNASREYIRNYDCAFDLNELIIVMQYSSWVITDNRFIELEPGVKYHNNAKYLQCEAHGCSVDKIELLRNGEPVRYIYQPQVSDNVIEKSYGAYKTIRYPLTHGDEDTYGTYECRATDKLGNSASKKVDIIKKRDVRIRLLEWTEDYTIVSCRASGDPLPTVSFGERLPDSFRDEISPARLPGEATFSRRWIVQGPWYVRPVGPFGEITEGIYNITMPVDSIRGKTIFCISHGPFGTQQASMRFESYKFPREPRTWDRAY